MNNTGVLKPRIPTLWVGGMLLMTLAVLTGCGAKTISSQYELSREMGEFRASRYVIFKGCDQRDCYFQEASKFGPLGGSAKFKVARTLIDFQGAKVNEVAQYRQNDGEFRVGFAPDAKIIKADFVEHFTKEEENFSRAMSYLKTLPAKERGTRRIEALDQVARTAYDAQKYDVADEMAGQLLSQVLAFPDDEKIWASHFQTAHRVAGLVDLQRGNVEDAKAHLLMSAKAPGSTLYSASGPNVSLARELLLIGERDTVLNYLELCKQFWKVDQIEAWQQEIRANQMPDFGANLRY